MKKFILTVLVLLCCLPFPAAGKKNPTRDSALKLMSYNIRFATAKDTAQFNWNYRRKANLKMLREQKPDVIGVQEGLANAVSYLEKHLPEYAVYKVADPDKPTQLSKNEIFWRRDKYACLDSGLFWLGRNPEAAVKDWGANQKRNTIWVKLREISSGKVFYVFNTHIEVHAKEAKKKGIELNVEMMQDIAGDKVPVFITGDMNVSRRKGNGYLLDPYYEWMSSAREAARVTNDRPSHNAFGREGSKPGYLDHIFYRNAEALVFDVMDGDYGVPYISDHYPITCIFTY